MTEAHHTVNGPRIMVNEPSAMVQVECSHCKKPLRILIKKSDLILYLKDIEKHEKAVKKARRKKERETRRKAKRGR